MADINKPLVGRRHFFSQASGMAATALVPAITVSAASAASAATAAAKFEPLSASAFSTALNTAFQAYSLDSANAITAATPITLILESVEARQHAHPNVSAARAKEKAFSLKFSASTPNLPQDTYAISHPSLGTLPMLLVPSPNGKFMCAEYNRI
jgi:hypothetical protein